MTIAELIELEIAEAVENDSLEEMLEFYMEKALASDPDLLNDLIEARS